MNLNNISSLNFNKNIVLKSPKQNACYSINGIKSGDFKVATYPKNYYLNQISFGAKKLSADEMIAKIGEENFPSPEIIKRLKNIGESTDFSLYDIHLDYYKDLLDCKTLNEAKELYPEFKDVIDAKDVDIKPFNKKNIFRRIVETGYKGIDIENLSLDLLKKQYGNMYSTAQKEHYFGLSVTGVRALFDIFNIKVPEKIYIMNAFITPQRREKQSKSLSKYLATPEGKKQRKEAMDLRWANDDGTLREQSRQNQKATQTPEARAKHKATCNTDEFKQRESQKMQRRWQEDEEFIKLQQERPWINDEYIISQRQISKESWANSDESRYEISRQNIKSAQTPEAIAKMRATKNTQEFKDEISETMREFNKNNPLYNKARILAWDRHPEITDKMSEIAQHYPMLGEIIRKQESGNELSEYEDKILRTYHKECERAIPGHMKIIGKEYHNILVEWGLIE